MSVSGLQGRDLFMRHTGGDGKSYVNFHRVWDADRFEAAQKAAQAAPAGPPPTMATSKVMFDLAWRRTHFPLVGLGLNYGRTNSWLQPPKTNQI